MLAQYVHVMSQDVYRSPPGPSDKLLSTTIDIPIAILGLLLTKKESLNILSQIKQYTSTQIQKVAKEGRDDIPEHVERFEVTGHIQEKIDLAVHTLQRIISGINIGVVMRELRQTAIAKGYYNKHSAEEKPTFKQKEARAAKGKREKVTEEK